MFEKTSEHHHAENMTFEVSDDWKARAHLTLEQYEEMYQRSIDDPEGFWGDEGKRLDWMKPFTKVKNTSFAPGSIDINGTKMARSTLQ